MRPAAQPSGTDLPPSIFAMVMATGIVSLAADGAGHVLLAHLLFWLNVGLYALLLVLFLLHVLRHRSVFIADLHSHAKAPGFFTLVAAPCVLGSQCISLLRANGVGLVLWVVGLLCWFALSYAMLPGLMEGMKKPRPEEGINGTWLLTVVGTQAVSVLACGLAPGLGDDTRDAVLFLALSFWLVGGMLYGWLIAPIFHRLLFLPLSPGELTPPYWINMGAMAISTLAGVSLVAEAARMPLLGELLPFLKGMTLLFHVTATWWIPVLLALEAWRHLKKRFPLRYEHDDWAMVFPLGMYTVCTQDLIRVFRLPFLSFIPSVFVWIALAAWGMTFVGLVAHVIRWRWSRGDKGTVQV
jgi:tellurite resistance protein TehA-like permease